MVLSLCTDHGWIENEEWESREHPLGPCPLERPSRLYSCMSLEMPLKFVSANFPGKQVAING